jgi:hypothetical protein
VSSFPKAASAVVGACIASFVAPAALADIFGPDLRVTGQSLTTTVEFTAVLIPSYNESKPGVVVTMTNCKSGQKAPIRMVRRFGTLGPGQTLRARPGKLVWTLEKVPAKPAKRKLRFRLAVPKGVKTFCLATSMFDNFTKTTVNLRNSVPI